MMLLHRFASIVRWIFRRSEAEHHLDQELQGFIDLSVADKVRDGLSPAEARRLAVLELGGVEQAKERVRTYRHGGWLDDVGRDVRYALRMFVRNRTFSLVVVATLALGIGANTAIFGLIDALMLRWLPVRNPQELVQLTLQSPGSTRPGGESFSYTIVRAVSDQRQILSAVGGFTASSFDVGAAGATSRVTGALVTGDYYATLGLTPQLGRLISRTDDEPGAPLVAVISDGYWERQFARKPDVVGEVLRLNDLPVTVVGVSPRGFVGSNVGTVANITAPVAALARLNPEAAALLEPGNFWLRVLARPAPGVSRREAAARLNAAWPRLAEQVISPRWPASRRQEMADSVFTLVSGGTGWTYLREIYRKPLFVLMAAVALVLLIACANVASLLLARASIRQREVAVRLAIGAGRGRIVRQLLIESTLLSLTGAAVGIVLAWMSGQFLVSLISTGPVALTFDLSPNWHILLFSSAVAIATAVLFGVAPALQTASAMPTAVLRDDARVSTSRSRLLPWLVAAQVALSLVLLSGAGLFVRTVRNLASLDPGFSTEGVLIVELGGRRSPVPADIVEQAQRVPGVVSATLSTHTPLNGSVWSEPAVPSGQPLPEKDNAFFVAAGPRFFSTLGIRLLAGREFTDRDNAGAPTAAIVNEAYARRFFDGQRAVGQRLSATVRGERRELEVVGLARNTSAAGLRKEPPPTVYVAYAQLAGDFPSTLSVRASGPVAQVASALQQALQARLPGAPVDVRPLSVQVEATIVQERMMAMLAGAFGVLALALACVGLYGLLAYTVAQRTREIGIRMALGAPRGRVLALVLEGGNRLVLTGIVIGLPVAWIALRWLESMLFGVKPGDPLTLAGSIAVLVLSSQLAAYLPARRASRVDPLVALRHD